MRSSRTSVSRCARASGCGSPTPQSAPGSTETEVASGPPPAAPGPAASAPTRPGSAVSDLLRDGVGCLGVALIRRTRSAHHRSSVGTRRTVRHLSASPLGPITTCSPVRAICPTHTACTDLSASFFLCFSSLPLRIGLFTSLASTVSPISTTARLHFVPVSLSMGTMPSCPTENRLIRNAACSKIQSMMGESRGISTPRRLSSASRSARACAVASWTAFSHGPFDCGL